MTGASVTAIPVRFAPLIAGRVEGNLASGMVPESRLLAFHDDKSTAKSIVPSASWYVAVMSVSVLLLNIAPTIS